MKKEAIRLEPCETQPIAGQRLATSLDWNLLKTFHEIVSADGISKSHLARAMAGSAGVALVRGSFAAWQAQGNLSHMLRGMRASFDEAAAVRPAIMVIDEIDAVGDRADPDPHNNSYRAQVINGFLEALDSLAYIEGVMIVATTNYPDKIDAAVLRPGRIDIKAQVPLPGARALARMLRDALDSDIPPEEMARLTRAATGQSAADVDGALRQARSVARHENRKLAAPDVLIALSPEAEDHSPARERRIALHECGHAIVGTCLGLGKITRLVLTRQGGQAWLSHVSGEQMLEDLEAELTYALAGRAAERLILGKVAAGAGGNALSDLAHATQTATAIDTRMGLGAEGPVWLDISPAAYLRDPQSAARIRARLEAAEARAMWLLEARRDLLVRMAEDLVAVGLLEGDRLEMWIEEIRGMETQVCVEARPDHDQKVKSALPQDNEM
ncbi:AAA family ATPase [Roseovarius sp. M141]|uniref:AAA family ATPase n=1 Tax=Roseovarius sp. M141 TaxID=2583806 RepID=UPI0020CDA4A3|nr:AAA family ATPase [Roseovarius sp. M141]MCQ0090503.1 AAA family ATPase [Roseovarius sp. M141]